MIKEPPELDLNDEQVRKALLNTETAKIPWHELQRYFASGSTIYVDPKLDLLMVASEVMSDNKALVETWMGEGAMAPVSDEQAKNWYANNQNLWAVVLSPWVLVQPIANDSDRSA
jgi:hypothetical protein